jgi:hypothetical protein
MYLIGFFASPLPYIALLALYLSGFAFMGLRGHAPEEDMPGAEVAGTGISVNTLAFAAHDNDHQPEICGFAPSGHISFYPSSDGPEDSFTDRAAHQTIRFFPARTAFHRIDPPENLRSATLTAHPIRPPPTA